MSVEKSLKQSEKEQNLHQDENGDTFLHLAVIRTEDTISLIETNTQHIEGTSSLFKELCSRKNNQGKIPLEVALETGNIAGIKFLRRYTEEAIVLKNAFATKNNDVNLLSTTQPSEFRRIKREYRLLNNTYRDIFEECLQHLRRPFSWESACPKLDKALQKHPLGIYVFVDYPYLFKFLFANSENMFQFEFLIKGSEDIFKNNGNNFFEGALLEALNNPKFCTALKKSPDFTSIAHILMAKFGISKKDNRDPHQLLKDIYQTLKHPERSFETIDLEIMPQFRYSLH